MDSLKPTEEFDLTKLKEIQTYRLENYSKFHANAKKGNDKNLEKDNESEEYKGDQYDESDGKWNLLEDNLLHNKYEHIFVHIRKL